MQQGIGFGQAFEWDIPLLDGYNWNQLEPNLLTGSGNLDKFTSLRIKNPKNLIKRLNPSAVLLTGWQSLALVQLLYSCNHLKVPTFIRGDSNNLKPRKQLTKLLHKKLIKRYDKFLAVGKANKNFYIENGAKQSDIYICPHFVDNKQFIKNTKQPFQVTPNGERKIIDIIDCSGCGDVDTSTIVTINAKENEDETNTITGITGRKLTVYIQYICYLFLFIMI